MRRALGALALATLVLALVATARPTDDAGAATRCVTHSKRVVRHVRRHGKRKRVVRVVRHRICGPVKAPPDTAAPPATSAPPPPQSPPATTPPAEPPAGEPEAEANALGVAADDHGGHKSYTLSRGTVLSGRLTVQLRNKGEDPHDMNMQRVGPAGEPLGAVVEVPLTAPGEQRSRAVEVEPGTYRMWCNLFHHAEEGMEATVTVE